MSDKLYTYAVARIRSAETSLLTAQFLEQLIAAKDYEECVRLLADKGWGDADGQVSLPQLLRGERQRTWSFLHELTDGSDVFDVFFLPNDYHNLKTAIKLTYTGLSGDIYYMDDGTIPAETIRQAVKARDLSVLPEDMARASVRATQALAQTENGQLCDMILDKACLEAIYAASQKSDCEVVRRYGEITVACADLKIAVRCAKTHKKADFIKDALVPCDTLDLNELTKAAVSGMDAVTEYLKRTPYDSAADALTQSLSAFERWCDNLLIREIRPQRHNPFTAAPLAAFALAKENEIKTVRIVLSGKINHLPEASIRERVREMYV